MERLAFETGWQLCNLLSVGAVHQITDQSVNCARMAAAKLIGKQLDCKDLHGYLRTLPASVLDKLYNHPATCLAVFR